MRNTASNGKELSKQYDAILNRFKKCKPGSELELSLAEDLHKNAKKLHTQGDATLRHFKKLEPGSKAKAMLARELRATTKKLCRQYDATLLCSRNYQSKLSLSLKITSDDIYAIADKIQDALSDAEFEDFTKNLKPLTVAYLKKTQPGTSLSLAIYNHGYGKGEKFKFTFSHLEPLSEKNNKHISYLVHGKSAYLGEDGPPCVTRGMGEKRKEEIRIAWSTDLSPLFIDIETTESAPIGKARPSPSASATLFAVGAKRKGGDGQFWKVVETSSGVKRWGKV
ncbi:MAG: hypothetical protein LBF16_11065 [Pseudomonadales bacterium]|jgi:hypothetical protein|nr:hypothetical protein [Pseudomonadales bacterium]